MTDNEIIKVLELEAIYCRGEGNTYGPTKKTFVDAELIEGALALINRQKAEIERFKNRQKPTGASGYKIENGKVVFFTNMLGGCRHEYKDLDEVVKTLNELLQECYSKDEIAFALKCKTEDLKAARAESVKEFAERLKEKLYSIPTVYNSHFGRMIDNLVKEFTEGKVDD
jgi:hypothetical protein